nr:hypothetical protein [Tanacetum cinerariifolium]
MQKIILKQQYENFTASRAEGLDKTYDRQLSMDDLYNNLKVYKAEIKGQSSSNSNSKNVAFVSLNNTSSTNEAVNTAHNISTASSQGQASASTYADDIMFSFFANQSNSPKLDNDDLEQIDINDLEEIDLKWKVAMLTMRVKRFIKKTRRNLNINGKENRIENVIDDKVKIIRCDNETEFKNKEMNQFWNQANGNAGTKANINAGQSEKDSLWSTIWNQTNGNAGPKSSEDEVTDDAGKKSTEVPREENEFRIQQKKDTGIFSGAYDDEVEGAVADFNNLELTTVLERHFRACHTVTELLLLQLHSSGDQASKVLSRWSNPNKEPKFGSSYRDVLGAVADEGAGACCTCEMIGMDGRERVGAVNRRCSTVVVNEISTRGVDSKKESIHASGLGQDGTELLSVLMSRDKLDRCEHLIIPDIGSTSHCSSWHLCAQLDIHNPPTEDRKNLRSSYGTCPKEFELEINGDCRHCNLFNLFIVTKIFEKSKNFLFKR